VSGGVRQSAADTKSIPVNEDDAPHTAAEIRSLADQAEAEAAEAEALAAAARARARAIQLRREAEVAEVAEAKEQPITREAVAEGEVEKPADGVATEVLDTRKVEPEATEPAVQSGDSEPKDVETEERRADTDADAVTAAEPDDDASSIDDEAEAPAPRRWRGRLRRPGWSTVAAALAIVVTLAALSASVYMVLDHRHTAEQHRRAAEFAAVARQGVVTLTSMDFEHATEGVRSVIDVSTGSFKDDFLKMADDFTKVVEESKVVSQGTVQAAAVDLDTMTDNSAVVLVASTSEVTNAAGAKQDPRKYRLIVTVTRDGDQLKLSKVEFLP
jgi:Mce-associated membrane protein